MPPRPKEMDGLQMMPPSLDSKKKARGIKKLFGRSVEDDKLPFSKAGAYTASLFHIQHVAPWFTVSRERANVAFEGANSRWVAGRERATNPVGDLSCSSSNIPTAFFLYTRLKRSQSTTFNPDDLSETEFKRGGTRATAGPRLGWSRDLGQSHR